MNPDHLSAILNNVRVHQNDGALWNHSNNKILVSSFALAGLAFMTAMSKTVRMRKIY